MKKSWVPPNIIVVRKPGGDERGQHRREKKLKEDSTLFLIFLAKAAFVGVEAVMKNPKQIVPKCL